MVGDVVLQNNVVAPLPIHLLKHSLEYIRVDKVGGQHYPFQSEVGTDSGYRSNVLLVLKLIVDFNVRPLLGVRPSIGWCSL